VINELVLVFVLKTGVATITVSRWKCDVNWYFVSKVGILTKLAGVEVVVK